MCPVIFDIETGALPIEKLKEICDPFDPATLGRHPGEFDPSTVKLGHLKDKVKIDAKIEDSRAKHVAAVAAYEAKMATGETDYWADVEDKAALNGLTGEVLAIGYNGKAPQIDCRQGDDEATLLARFWGLFTKCRTGGRPMVGFNIADFDIPFLIQRSIILQVDIPEGVLEGRYLSKTFIDLRAIWKGGSFSNSTGSLDAICRACGLGAKTSGVNGSDFGRLYRNPETRSTAIDYLSNDIDLTKRLSVRMGLV